MGTRTHLTLYILLESLRNVVGEGSNMRLDGKLIWVFVVSKLHIVDFPAVRLR